MKLQEKTVAISTFRWCLFQITGFYFLEKIILISKIVISSSGDGDTTLRKQWDVPKIWISNFTWWKHKKKNDWTFPYSNIMYLKRIQSSFRDPFTYTCKLWHTSMFIIIRYYSKNGLSITVIHHLCTKLAVRTRIWRDLAWVLWIPGRESKCFSGTCGQIMQKSALDIIFQMGFSRV